ncbi:MAG TPA: hypothetical protein VIX73_18525 [Kofleriaceae bacterium]
MRIEWALPGHLYIKLAATYPARRQTGLDRANMGQAGPPLVQRMASVVQVMGRSGPGIGASLNLHLISIRDELRATRLAHRVQHRSLRHAATGVAAADLLVRSMDTAAE